ncbi:unnamed protein product [marine sediment metagenome]|uniref:Uncharacterized protein n=1 Tax=marine sediment metagenome TaxID=412755 RepID=X1AGT6_9ZZZZ
MIDNIVEMVLKEGRKRNRDHIFVGVYDVIEEVFHKVNWIIVEHMIEERRIKNDENKG